jgi:mRNA interferase MazF
MERGEVWWTNLAPPIGTRPVLLVSRSLAYRVRRSITVALITTSVRGIPVEVPLGPEDGMPRPCVVNCDEVHTVPIDRVDNRITTLSPEKMDAVADAVRFALDMECD